VRDIPRSTFAHQDEARFIPLSAGNGELILLTYLRGPKGLKAKPVLTNKTGVYTAYPIATLLPSITMYLSEPGWETEFSEYS